jgi:hypothetical protein
MDQSEIVVGFVHAVGDEDGTVDGGVAADQKCGAGTGVRPGGVKEAEVEEEEG